MARESHHTEVRISEGRVDLTMRVGSLPGEIAASFWIYQTQVRLDSACLRKLVEKHRLNASHLALIPVILNEGWCLRSRKSDSDLEFFYVETEKFGKRFVLDLKLLHSRQQIWVRSFHMTDEQQLRSRIRHARERGLVIRYPR